MARGKGVSILFAILGCQLTLFPSIAFSVDAIKPDLTACDEQFEFSIGFEPKAIERHQAVREVCYECARCRVDRSSCGEILVPRPLHKDFAQFFERHPHATAEAMEQRHQRCVAMRSVTKKYTERLKQCPRGIAPDATWVDRLEKAVGKDPVLANWQWIPILLFVRSTEMRKKCMAGTDKQVLAAFISNSDEGVSFLDIFDDFWTQRSPSERDANAEKIRQLKFLIENQKATHVLPFIAASSEDEKGYLNLKNRAKQAPVAFSSFIDLDPSFQKPFSNWEATRQFEKRFPKP